MLRRYPRTAALFLLLNVADLALTCHLLRMSAGEVYEANGVAAAVLEHFGVAGLAAFKAFVVLLAAILVAVVAAYRPAAAQRLAAFGCAAVGAVVLYSLALWGWVGAQPRATWGQGMAEIERQAKDLDRRQRNHAEFRADLERTMAALAAGQCTLREAVARLRATVGGKDPSVVALYRSAVDTKSDAECLAAMTVNAAIVQLYEEGSTAGRRRVHELLGAYRAEYGPELCPYLLATVEEFEPGRPDERQTVAAAPLPEVPHTSGGGWGMNGGSPRFAPRGRHYTRGWPRAPHGGRFNRRRAAFGTLPPSAM